MNTNVEIIDFYRPNSNRKNLFITNIPGDKHEDDISVLLYDYFIKYGLIYGIKLYSTPNKSNIDSTTENKQRCVLLYDIFIKYGLIYGIQVYSTPNKPNIDSTTENKQESETQKFYYAFVTFYSMLDAARAKDDLNGMLQLGDCICKVAYAKRKKEVDEQKVLYFSKCYELVNYYLGFNSWCTQIKTMFEDTDISVETDQTRTVKYVCLIKLTLKDLNTEGIGVWQETFSKTDPESKIKAVCKSRKCCHMRAIENAFSKVLLIVLDNGKVTVEIDTTKPDFHSDNIQDEQLVKVNSLDEQPESEEAMADIGEETWDASASNIDDINLHILQELEEDMS